MDSAWWEHYGPEVDAVFRGERFSLAARKGVARVRSPFMRVQGQNSGAGAIALAHHFGARRVLLLGYDCQHTGGKTHWHGDHPQHRIPGRQLGNAGSVAKWPGQFAELRRLTPGLEIINCSRDTALTIFPRAALEDVL